MSAVQTTLTALQFLLAFVFFMAGANKLTPLIHAPTHAYMVEASAAWPRALYLDLVGMDAVTLRIAIGIAEVFSGVVLLTPKAPSAAMLLQIVMLGAALTHARLGEPVVVPLVLFALLAALRVLHARVEAGARERAAVAAGKAQ